MSGRECGATDGRSVCTEPAGHAEGDPEQQTPHWDRRTEHEWIEEPEIDDSEPGAGSDPGWPLFPSLDEPRAT